MCLVSERGQTWAWKFITCTATRWRQPIHQAKLSPRSQTFPIKRLPLSLSLLLPLAWKGKSRNWCMCVYRKQQPCVIISAALRMHSHCWPGLFLPFTFINTLAAARGDIKGIAGSRGRAFSDTCSLVHQSLTGPSVTMKRFHYAARQKLILALIHHAQPTCRSTDLICNAWLLAGDFLKAAFINSANPGMVLEEALGRFVVSNCC